ncbi:hypothetical protein L3X38_013534 [Prunus dulcis]|uniref:Uncharacterized protein n=1 Tax=Prunus dulcis TaxID=3755 RepID=A0AAD4WNM6_PRUDU|nr:hypothetical protein L3X38_013534 [Prunus dulcis]
MSVIQNYTALLHQRYKLFSFISLSNNPSIADSSGACGWDSSPGTNVQMPPPISTQYSLELYNHNCASSSSVLLRRHPDELEKSRC